MNGGSCVSIGGVRILRDCQISMARFGVCSPTRNASYF